MSSRRLLSSRPHNARALSRGAFPCRGVVNSSAPLGRTLSRQAESTRVPRRCVGDSPCQFVVASSGHTLRPWKPAPAPRKNPTTSSAVGSRPSVPSHLGGSAVQTTASRRSPGGPRRAGQAGVGNKQLEPQHRVLNPDCWGARIVGWEGHSSSYRPTHSPT